MTRTTVRSAARFAVVLVALHAAWPQHRADGARLLFVETVAGKSHWSFMSGVIRALLDTGRHSVHVFTPFPEGSGRRNYTETDLSGQMRLVTDVSVAELMDRWANPSGDMGPVLAYSRRLCDSVFGNREMDELLRRGARPAHFDAVLVEPFLSGCVSYVATRLDAPLVYVVGMPTANFLNIATTGHAFNPAAESNIMSTPHAPGTFGQRFRNAVLTFYGVLGKEYEEHVQRTTDPKPYDAVAAPTPSLVLVNGHFVSNVATPVPTNFVNVAGVHLKAPASLPEDIKEFIEQSPNGVVYFTLGSTVKMSTVPEHIKKTFLTALAQIPRRILMKYEEELENKPKNIMVKKWLPQRDILAHPNVKLFISHGGISGLYEAIDAGIPVLGFPLFGDQPRNIDHLVNAGMAISMDLFTVTEESFSKNVLELLDDKKYMENAKTASIIFKDRPVSPAQSVVYWIEYVLRHKGAKHLKSHAINLSWYQYYLLDVISTLSIIVFVTVFVTYKGLKYFSKLLQMYKAKDE